MLQYTAYLAKNEGFLGKINYFHLSTFSSKIYYMSDSKLFPNLVDIPDDLVSNFKNKEYNICKEKCNNILISNPKNVMALIYLGHIAESEKNYEISIDYFKRVTEAEPRMPFMWSRIGEIYSQIEKYEEALKAFTKEIKLTPREALPWCMASMCAQKIECHNLAIWILKWAQEKVKKEGQSIISYTLGTLEEIAGNNDEALVNYMHSQLCAKNKENKDFSAERIYKLLTKQMKT